MRDPKTGRYVKAETNAGTVMKTAQGYGYKETDVLQMNWGDRVQLTPKGYAAYLHTLHQREIDQNAMREARRDAAYAWVPHEGDFTQGQYDARSGYIGREGVNWEHTPSDWFEYGGKLKPEYRSAMDFAAVPLTPQHFGALGNDGFRDMSELKRTGNTDAQTWTEAYPVASERVQSDMIADRVERFAEAAGWPEPKPARGFFLAFLLMLFLIVGVSIGVLLMHPTW